MVSKEEELSKLIEKVELIKEDGLITLVDEIATKYDEFHSIILKSKYLEELTEDKIYETYKGAI